MLAQGQSDVSGSILRQLNRKTDIEVAERTEFYFQPLPQLTLWPWKGPSSPWLCFLLSGHCSHRSCPLTLWMIRMLQVGGREKKGWKSFKSNFCGFTKCSCHLIRSSRDLSSASVSEKSGWFSALQSLLIALGSSLSSADKAQLIRQDASNSRKSLLASEQWPFFPEVNAFEMIPDKPLELKTWSKAQYRLLGHNPLAKEFFVFIYFFMSIFFSSPLISLSLTALCSNFLLDQVSSSFLSPLYMSPLGDNFL